MTQPLTLYWIRRDFRLSDNAALTAAASRGSVLPVFIQGGDTGGWPEGGATRWWMRQSLAALEERYRRLGSPLVLRTGDPVRELPRLAAACGASAVTWNRLYEPAQQCQDQAVAEALARDGVTAESFAGSLLREPGAVLTGQGGPYRVFTPYWKQAASGLSPGRPAPAPARLQAPALTPGGEPLRARDLAPAAAWQASLARHWQPGEAAAHAALERFTDCGLAGYRTQRDLPAVDGVSRLSPHLHFGELSPRQVWHAISQAATASRNAAGAETFLRQLGWREFAHHILHHFPHTTEQPMYPKFRRFPWRRAYREDLHAWQRGRTGIPIVDAGMRQLWQTGWMHNRVRMLAASLLVKNLLVPWLEGARWFWDTLVDADLANNSMGWQWTAGCGADAAPYFRIFNPVLQGQKFDPAGDYVRRWVPELAGVPDRYVHCPWQWRGGRLGYPAPVVDLAQSRRTALLALKSLRDTG